MRQYEAVEIGKLETTINKAFIDFGRKNGYNPKMDINTLKTYININNKKFVISDYIVCKDGMILADLKQIN